MVYLDFMPVKTFRPLTPSTRYITVASFDEITKDSPERSLISIRKVLVLEPAIVFRG